MNGGEGSSATSVAPNNSDDNTSWRACRSESPDSLPRMHWDHELPTSIRPPKDCGRFSLSHRTRRAAAPSQRVGEGRGEGSVFSRFMGGLLGRGTVYRGNEPASRLGNPNFNRIGLTVRITIKIRITRLRFM